MVGAQRREEGKASRTQESCGFNSPLSCHLISLHLLSQAFMGTLAFSFSQHVSVLSKVRTNSQGQELSRTMCMSSTLHDGFLIMSGDFRCGVKQEAKWMGSQVLAGWQHLT